jgi:hypothetical protein
MRRFDIDINVSDICTEFHIDWHPYLKVRCLGKS